MEIQFPPRAQRHDDSAGRTAGTAGSGRRQRQPRRTLPRPRSPPRLRRSSRQACCRPAELAIKLPEGKKADQKFLDGYVATAKKLGLSQEQAQGIADHFIAIRDRAGEAVGGRPEGAHREERRGSEG
jgi:hypothetical protein